MFQLFAHRRCPNTRCVCHDAKKLLRAQFSVLPPPFIGPPSPRLFDAPGTFTLAPGAAASLFCIYSRWYIFITRLPQKIRLLVELKGGKKIAGAGEEGYNNGGTREVDMQHVERPDF